MTRPSELRRAQAAENTRAAIVDAAQHLFVERGYGATTVEQIAKLADVSPATVYAVTGGKRGLVDALVRRWADSPTMRDGFDELFAVENPYTVLRLVAGHTRSIREEHGDVVRILLAGATSNVEVAAELERVTTGYRDMQLTIARHLSGLGVGHPPEKIADVLWFFFGYGGFFALVDESGWTYDDAEQWLTDQCAAALGIRPPRRRAS